MFFKTRSAISPDRDQLSAARTIGSTARPASFASSASRSSGRTDRSTAAGSTVGSTEPPSAAGVARRTGRRIRVHSSCGNSRSCRSSAGLEPIASTICASFSLRAGKRGRALFSRLACAKGRSCNHTSHPVMCKRDAPVFSNAAGRVLPRVTVVWVRAPTERLRKSPKSAPVASGFPRCLRLAVAAAQRS